MPRGVWLVRAGRRELSEHTAQRLVTLNDRVRVPDGCRCPGSGHPEWVARVPVAAQLRELWDGAAPPKGIWISFRSSLELPHSPRRDRLLETGFSPGRAEAALSLGHGGWLSRPCRLSATEPELSFEHKGLY